MERSRTGAGGTRTAAMRGGGVLERMRRAGTGVLLALLLSRPAAAEPIEPGYAGTKIASPARTSRTDLRLTLPARIWPQRGMLVATGNILSPLARWIVLDLDLWTIRQATTRLTDGNGASTIERERTDAFADRERRMAIAAANEVWSTRDPDPPVPGEVTDALCNVTLFDGDDVLHEIGFACPRAHFVAVLEAVATSADRRATRAEPLPGAR